MINTQKGLKRYMHVYKVPWAEVDSPWLNSLDYTGHITRSNTFIHEIDPDTAIITSPPNKGLAIKADILPNYVVDSLKKVSKEYSEKLINAPTREAVKKVYDDRKYAMRYAFDSALVEYRKTNPRSTKAPKMKQPKVNNAMLTKMARKGRC